MVHVVVGVPAVWHNLLDHSLKLVWKKVDNINSIEIDILLKHMASLHLEPETLSMIILGSPSEWISNEFTGS